MAGDVTAAELRPLAERTYGAHRRPARAAARCAAVEPPQHAERRVILRHERVRQPNLIRSYLAPSFSSAGRRACLCARGAGRDPGRRRHQPPLSARWWSSRRWPPVPAPSIAAAGSTAPPSASTPARARASSWTALEAAVDARDRARAGGRRHRGRARRARSGACWPRPSMPATRSASPPSVFGMRPRPAAQTVADVEAWPARIAAVTTEQVQRPRAPRPAPASTSRDGQLLPAAAWAEPHDHDCPRGRGRSDADRESARSRPPPAPRGSRRSRAPRACAPT